MGLEKKYINFWLLYMYTFVFSITVLKNEKNRD